MSDDILTIKQTAEYLKVCEKTIRRLIKSNKIPASKVGARSWRIKKMDIDEYLNNNKNTIKD